MLTFLRQEWFDVSSKAGKLGQIHEKNGDFPIKHCDFPIKHCDFPIKNCDFPIKNMVNFPLKMVIFHGKPWPGNQDLSPQRATASDSHGIGAEDHGASQGVLNQRWASWNLGCNGT